jgi:hypothetical protein
MKKILFAFILLLQACQYEEPEYRWLFMGELTSIRVDDDAQYHFLTDYFAEHDVSANSVAIQRSNILKPILHKQQYRCPEQKRCTKGNQDWLDNYKYKVILPLNYKIETFDD